ncbi:hypothetical protein AMTR_s00001p00124650 [Amborella trichopoda]|uniref:Uncharacterized protein n=1 Tax=Amborella trichopoda TaxID=13333 RepID=W1NL33_AMBTC|nr:hypothetical protein AMTR_s00001p00124650 [Amborella trichopoda]
MRNCWPEANTINLDGLKTGMYYLRTRAAADAIKFSVDTESLKNPVATEDNEDERMKQVVCSLENRDACLACGS